MPNASAQTPNQNKKQNTLNPETALMYRLSQMLVVGVPLSAVLTGYMDAQSKSQVSHRNYSIGSHGVNLGASEKVRSLHHRADFLNEYSTDFSKAVQSAWRLTTVLPTDILRYGFRGFSQLYIQPLLELVRRGSRNLISPVIQEAILPTVNGKNLEGAEHLYPHLTHYEFQELQKEINGFQLHQMEGLHELLTKDSLRGDIKLIPDALKVMPLYRENPKTGQYEKVSMSHLPQLMRHIELMVRPDDYAADSATLAKYGWRNIPHYSTHRVVNGEMKQQNKATIQHELFSGSVSAYRHVVDTVKLGDFMPEYQQFLQLAAQGRLTHHQKVDKSTAKELLTMGVDDPLEREHRVNAAFLNHLFEFVELSSKKTKELLPFGRDTLGYVKHSLLKELSGLLPESKALTPEERLESVLNKIVHSPSLILNQNTRHKIDIEFDPQGKLNLKEADLKTVSQRLTLHLNQVRALVEESKSLLNTPRLSPQAFQNAHQKILNQFEHERLLLGTVFPSRNQEGVSALNKVLEQKGKEAYHFITQGVRHYIAMYHTIPMVKDRMLFPEVLVNSLLGFSFLGLLWNALDVHRIQPYEAKIANSKGDVKGSGTMFALSLLPGITLMTGLLANGALRKWTNNSPLMRFLVASAVGLGTSSFCAYALIRGRMESKPEQPVVRNFKLKSNVEIFHHTHDDIVKALKKQQTLQQTPSVSTMVSPLSLNRG